MIEEEGPIQPSPQQHGHDRELLLYDFFKHLTSLVLLTLGGVLVVAQQADPADVKPAVVIAVLVIISASGICAFGGSSEIVKARYTNVPSRSLEFYRKAAPTLLALGVGVFLAIFVDSLD